MAAVKPDTPTVASIDSEIAQLQQESAAIAQSLPLFTPTQLIESKTFASYPKPVLQALLTQPEYTIADAKSVIDTYLGTGGNK